MSDPFVAEIKIFAGNFAPRSYAFCDGQLLQVSQNTALFSLLGTTYGGDGRTTFGLPNLQGRAPMHPGSGPGLASRRLGEKGGAETVTLTEAQIPSHNHPIHGSTGEKDSNTPAGNAFGTDELGDSYRDTDNVNMKSGSGGALASTGGGQAHNNLQPYLTLNFIIALQGTFPSRS